MQEQGKEESGSLVLRGQNAGLNGKILFSLLSGFRTAREDERQINKSHSCGLQSPSYSIRMALAPDIQA